MITALLTPIAFIVTIGLLVIVHEFGHYQVAKWCNVKVLKFSIGFGKPLFSKVTGRDQTEFVLAAIPLGGYVKMLSEAELINTSEYDQHDMQRSLERATLGKRMAIVLAGSFANLLLAIVLYWGLLMMGVVGLKPIIGSVADNSPAARASIASGDTIQSVAGKPVTTWQDARWALLNASLKAKPITVQTHNAANEVHIHQLDLSSTNKNADDADSDQDIIQKIGLTIYQPVVAAKMGMITSNSRAAQAGLQENDVVLKANNISVTTWDGFVKVVRENPENPIQLQVDRQGVQLALSLTPESVTENNQTIGRIGAAFQLDQAVLNELLVTKEYSVLSALGQATVKTWETAIFSLKMLGNMLAGNVSVKSLSGPLTIANFAGQSANMGLKAFISFLALISISIGVLNLLPIPVLDGGHFMYYVIEFFTKKPVPESMVLFGQKIGFALLGAMMFIALFNDINRLLLK